MNYIYTLKILIVGLTAILALTNFSKSDFCYSLCITKKQI